MRVAPGALRVAMVPGIVAVIGAVTGVWELTGLGGVAVIAVLGFYRDPTRRPAGEGILAPADGIVKQCSSDDGLEVATFLNIYHVHVVRAPMAGEVHTVERVDGHRRAAFRAGAAENAGVHIETDTWSATLRAGAVARRVRSYVAVGDTLDRGERIGHIAFGSRVDLAVDGVDPDEVAVAVGDRVAAGRTVIAEGPSQ